MDSPHIFQHCYHVISRLIYKRERLIELYKCQLKTRQTRRFEEEMLLISSKMDEQVEEFQARSSIDTVGECEIASKQNGQAWSTKEDTEGILTM